MRKYIFGMYGQKKYRARNWSGDDIEIHKFMQKTFRSYVEVRSTVAQLVEC